MISLDVHPNLIVHYLIFYSKSWLSFMCNVCNKHAHRTCAPVMEDGNRECTKCKVNHNILCSILPVCEDQSVSDSRTAAQRSEGIPRAYHDSTTIVLPPLFISHSAYPYHNMSQSFNLNVVSVKMQSILIAEVVKRK